MHSLTIHIERKQIGDRTAFTSPDMPGFYVSHQNADFARSGVEASIRSLQRALKQDDKQPLHIVEIGFHEPAAHAA